MDEREISEILGVRGNVREWLTAVLDGPQIDQRIVAVFPGQLRTHRLDHLDRQHLPRLERLEATGAPPPSLPLPLPSHASIPRSPEML